MRGLPSIRRQPAGALVLLAASWLLPDEARACGATCSIPEFWDVQLDPEGQLAIVSNFGLIRQTDRDWYLVCEAAIGEGFIISAESTRAGPFVSTTEGLYRETDAACGYAPVDLGEADAQPLAVASSADGAEQFVLLLPSADSDEVAVSRLSAEAGPVVLHRLPRDDGYRQLSVQADWLFATGYSFSPRTWRVAFASGATESEPAGARTDASDVAGSTADAGKPAATRDAAAAGALSWSELEFAAEDDSTLEPLGHDPELPHALLLRAQTPSDEPAELHRFDARDGSLERIFVLEDTDDIVGYAVSGDYQFLAARQDVGGAVYRALRGSDGFEKMDVELPDLSCLVNVDGALIACGNDFTRSTPFILGRSEDFGSSWQPAMELSELGTIDGCADDCQTTLNWLLATYGALSVTGLAGDAGVDAGAVDTTVPARGLSLDAGSASSAAESDATVTDAETARGRDGGCALAVPRTIGSPFGAWIALLGALLLRRTRGRGVDAEAERLIRRPEATIGVAGTNSCPHRSIRASTVAR